MASGGGVWLVEEACGWCRRCAVSAASGGGDVARLSFKSLFDGSALPVAEISLTLLTEG